MIYVLGIIIWAVLVLHAIADRSVLNIRTVATCAVAGALWGPFLYNSSIRFLSIFGVDPDKDNLIPLFTICLMALLIWWCSSGRACIGSRVWRTVSWLGSCLVLATTPCRFPLSRPRRFALPR